VGTADGSQDFSGFRGINQRTGTCSAASGTDIWPAAVAATTPE